MSAVDNSWQLHAHIVQTTGTQRTDIPAPPHWAPAAVGGQPVRRELHHAPSLILLVTVTITIFVLLVLMKCQLGLAEPRVRGDSSRACNGWPGVEVCAGEVSWGVVDVAAASAAHGLRDPHTQAAGGATQRVQQFLAGDVRRVFLSRNMTL